ncbi:hypothetical protein CYMTET_53114, partial [Cymbomonas tetramitiformis]
EEEGEAPAANVLAGTDGDGGAMEAEPAVDMGDATVGGSANDGVAAMGAAAPGAPEAFVEEEGRPAALNISERPTATVGRWKAIRGVSFVEEEGEAPAANVLAGTDGDGGVMEVVPAVDMGDATAGGGANDGVAAVGVAAPGARAAFMEEEGEAPVANVVAGTDGDGGAMDAEPVVDIGRATVEGSANAGSDVAHMHSMRVSTRGVVRDYAKLADRGRSKRSVKAVQPMTRRKRQKINFADLHRLGWKDVNEI